MASLIRLPNANFSNLSNAGVIPTILSYDDLEGAYWLASGTEEQRLRNHAGDDKPSLTKVGSPILETGLTVVGAGNGFTTAINEPVDLTYIAVQAIYDDTLNDSAFILGEYNNDPASADYGCLLWANDSTDKHYFTYGAGTAGTTTLSSNANSEFASVSPITGFRFYAGTINATTDSVNWYNPAVSSSPTRTTTPTAGTLTTRNRTRVNTEAVKVRLGIIDDASQGQLNGAVAFAMVYSRALTTAEVIAQYDATKAQLQALFPSNTRYADL